MIARGCVPRALFTSNEGQAIGALRAFSEHQIRVPQDVALVCFNGTNHSSFHVPTLTTVRQPLREMARSAIQMLKEGESEAQLKEFPHYLEIGESCGCQPQSQS
jgi:LacI family transcriptional regulator